MNSSQTLLWVYVFVCQPVFVTANWFLSETTNLAKYTGLHKVDESNVGDGKAFDQQNLARSEYLKAEGKN